MTDRSFALFEPDALVPAQFYAAFRRSAGTQGAKRLMLAVLQDAVDCYQKYAFARDESGRQLFEEANAWIAARDHAWHFSFENICTTLNLDSEYVRRGLQNWRRRSLALPCHYGAQPPVAFDEARAAAVG